MPLANPIPRMTDRWSMRIIRALMALLLSTAFVIPSSGFPLPSEAEAPDDGCPFCQVIHEDLSCCEDACCESEEPDEEPVQPCDGNDCQCPDCPGPPPTSLPLNAVDFTQTHRFLPSGRSLLNPGSSPEWCSWNEAPVPPPPRVG